MLTRKEEQIVSMATAAIENLMPPFVCECEGKILGKTKIN